MENKKKQYTILFSLLLCAFLLVFLPACQKAENTAIARKTEQAKAGGIESREHSAIEKPAASGISGAKREMLLVRGNYWANGIPGFGENLFSALSGEYKYSAVGMAASDAAAETDVAASSNFLVYVTMERLYFSSKWQARSGTGNTSVLQCTDEEGFLVSTVLDDGKGNLWTAIFCFPEGFGSSGLSDADFNLLFRTWMDRMNYYLTLSKTPRDVSLPAALEF